jgi:hypothetical protein
MGFGLCRKSTSGDSTLLGYALGRRTSVHSGAALRGAKLEVMRVNRKSEVQMTMMPFFDQREDAFVCPGERSTEAQCDSLCER